ncbi:MAG: DUF3102 domain-containing protein [Candidatus Fimivivens sp.]
MNSTALKIIKNEAVTEKRSLNTITAEIVTITHQTQLMILHSAIEVGRRLCEAKEQVPHGTWGDYLKNEVNFSVSTANNFMRVFKEYGDDQIPLFGDSKSQTFGNLTYSKAVALFAVPESERENFVAENDVENISVSELKKRIAERDKQLADAQSQSKATAENLTQLQSQLAALKENSGKVSEKELKALQAKAEQEAKTKANAELEKVLAASAEETAKAIEQQKQLEQQLKAAQDTAKVESEKAIAEEKKKITALETKLKSVKDNAKAEAEKSVADELKKITVLEEQLKAAQDSNKATVEKAAASEKKKVAALEEKLKNIKDNNTAAAAELKATQTRTAELEKKLKLADTDTTVFAVHFEDLQSCINKLNGLLSKIEQGEDKETAKKLKAALKTVLTATIEKL